jgi:hypothetical protein
MDGRGHELIEHWHLPEKNSEPQDADVPAEIRTKHLPNTNLERYGCTNLLITDFDE